MNITKEEALNKLYDYFKYETSSLLKILDTPSTTAAKRGGYTGVTAGYLMEYVVPKIDISLFLECINELLLERYISKMHCTNINKIVFEKYESDYVYTTNNDPVTMYDLDRSSIALANSYKTIEMLDEEK